MNICEELLRSVLAEEANHNAILDAIRKKYEVAITYYDDDKPNGKGVRYIIPVAYGVSAGKNKHMLLRAFQYLGDARSKTVAWKLFIVDKINSWKPMKRRKFSTKTLAQYNVEGQFNPTGDKAISNPVIADVNLTRMKNDALLRYNERRRAEKMANDNLYGIKSQLARGKRMADANVLKNIEKPQNRNYWDEYEKALAEKNPRNAQSVTDMARVKDFGDDNSQTYGPIQKGQDNSGERLSGNQNDYSEIENDGAIYKR